jgi:NAD-dependent SIR2 family protein deacetylase
MRSRQVPRCPGCGGVARPNILMFGDFSWLDGRTAAQRARFEEFLEEVAGRRRVVVELGAGTAIPTIRWTSEQLGRGGARVVRVNPREPEIPAPHLSIAAGALEALSGIDRALG